jgi:hypothetical protein
MAGFSLAAIDEILGRLLSGPGEASIWLGRDYSIADLRRDLEALRVEPPRDAAEIRRRESERAMDEALYDILRGDPEKGGG